MSGDMPGDECVCKPEYGECLGFSRRCFFCAEQSIYADCPNDSSVAARQGEG